LTRAPRRPTPTAWAVAFALVASGCQATHAPGDAEIETTIEAEPSIEKAEPSITALAPSELGADQWSGLDRAELTVLLGAADFDRRDGPAQILQYRNDTCTLDIFLYRDSTEEPYRVAHVEARDLELREVPGGDCLRRLRETLHNKTGQS
jgi:hypothetical protein